MSDDVCHAEALMWMELEHAGDQVFELIGEESLRLPCVMCLPEEICPVRCKKFEVYVLRPRHLEWWMLCKHDEQDNGCCEEVNDLTLIWLLFENLRGHVSWCSDNRSVKSATISSFKRACEAKVDYL